MCSSDLAGAVFALPYLAPGLGHPELGDGIAAHWFLPLIAGGLWLIWRPPRELARRGVALAVLSVLAIGGFEGAASGKLGQGYDLRGAARHLAGLQRAGHPIAHYGKYHGQFNFLGRLEKPLAITGDGEVVQWIKRNPGGKIVSYHLRLAKGAKPDFTQRFRNRVLAVWDGTAVLADPSIAKRGAE